MKAVVVTKVSKLRGLEARSPERVEMLRRVAPEMLLNLDAAARDQEIANDHVAAALDQLGFEATFVTRDSFEPPASDVDVVVAVGGDGTVLDVSHQVLTTPIVGINSDPVRSVGYFCAADAASCLPVFAGIRDGLTSRVRLNRIAMTVDGREYPYPCMNDLLVTNRNPAMMSRYLLTAGGRTESHASSGIWISTPAGSTAGIRSAGGTVMPLQGALIQYLVREPYAAGPARYPLLRGVRHLREGLQVRSLMDDGVIYVDGPYIEVPLPIGSTVELHDGPPVFMYGLDPARRER